jgi:hypothetical protein
MRRIHFGVLIGAAALLCVLGISGGHAATITIINGDGAGEGFNDPTAAAPIGGNPGTTVGDQRLYVFQYAANKWGSILPSAVQIKVLARFNPLTCTATSGVLGSAGPKYVFRDFGGAPFGSTWYHSSLADRLAGTDLAPDTADINATFNSSVGGATCLPSGWYLGVDGNEGSQIELLPVVLHELGHGLGFSTTTSGSTGAQLSGFPGSYDHFLYASSFGQYWYQMTDANRAASAISCNKLVWNGPQVTTYAPAKLGPNPLLTITTPPGIAGDYVVGTASYGPPLSAIAVTGPVVRAIDGTSPTGDGCETITNSLTGAIALIDRGLCTFAVKTKNAQNAGAIGVIIADNAAGCPPAALGGTDPTVTIPTVRVTQADGALIAANLGSGVTARLLLDPAKLAGADASGRVMMYAPVPFTSGSSVSHWDVTAEPSLLMEPAITTGLSQDTDLTSRLFADIGWYNGVVAVAEMEVPAGHSLGAGSPNPTRSGASIGYSLPRNEQVDLAIYDLSGRLVRNLVAGPMSMGQHTARWDGRDVEGRAVAAGLYFYRMRTPTFSQSHSLVVLR